MTFKNILHNQIESGFADFKGARFEAKIPITSELMTELATAFVEEKARFIQNLRMTVKESNTITLSLRVKKGIAPTIPLSFDIILPTEVDFSISPVMVISMSRLGRTLGIIAFMFDSLTANLPQWMSLNTSTRKIEVDLKGLMNDAGLAFLVPFVKCVGIETVDGSVVLNVRAGII